MSYYTFNDEGPSQKFQKNKHVLVPDSAMRVYYEWRRLVRDYGHDPQSAAQSVGDSNSEKLQGGLYSFRLSKEHRVVYAKEGNKITVHSIGGHY